MQSYTQIASSTPMTDSLALLLNNDKTAISCHEGAAFPTANLIRGMLCFRSDEGKLYQLTNLTTPTWKLIFDLNKTATDKEYVDATFVKKTEVGTAAAKNLTIDTTAPASPEINDIWLDVS